MRSMTAQAVRCTYLIRGRRCRRQVAANSDLCPYHLEWVAGPPPANAWGARIARKAGNPGSRSQADDDQVGQLALLLRYGPTPPQSKPAPSAKCTYVARGKRCRRQAAAGSQFCPYHLAWLAGPRVPRSWAARVSREAVQLLAQTRPREGLDDEIALIRLLIRESFGQGRYAATCRAIDTLGDLLQVRQRMQPTSLHPPASLEKFLERLALAEDAP